MVMASNKLDRSMLYVGIIFVLISMVFLVRKFVKKRENKNNKKD